jgi:hypothetical protein
MGDTPSTRTHYTTQSPYSPSVANVHVCNRSGHFAWLSKCDSIKKSRAFSHARKHFMYSHQTSSIAKSTSRFYVQKVRDKRSSAVTAVAMLLLVSATSVTSRRSLVSTVPALGLAIAALLLIVSARAVTALVVATMLLRWSTVGVWLLVSWISTLLWWSTVGLLSI